MVQKHLCTYVMLVLHCWSKMEGYGEKKHDINYTICSKMFVCITFTAHLEKGITVWLKIIDLKKSMINNIHTTIIIACGYKKGIKNSVHLVDVVANNIRHQLPCVWIITGSALYDDFAKKKFCRDPRHGNIHASGMFKFSECNAGVATWLVGKYIQTYNIYTYN